MSFLTEWVLAVHRAVWFPLLWIDRSGGPGYRGSCTGRATRGPGDASALFRDELPPAPSGSAFTALWS